MSERGVWVATPSGLIPKHLYHRPIAARSDLSAPMVIRDTMEPTLNPANGKRYDSKRAYEKAVRASGCTIVGNEKVNVSRPGLSDPTPDIVQAVEQVTNRTTKRRKKRERV